MTLLLTERQYVEGIFGALAWLITRQFRDGFDSIYGIGAVAWTLAWFMRKIGTNIYDQIVDAADDDVRVRADVRRVACAVMAVVVALGAITYARGELIATDWAVIALEIAMIVPLLV